MHVHVLWIARTYNKLVKFKLIFFVVNEEDQIHQTFNGSNVNKFEDS